MGDLTRITHNPAVMGGKACIRGMRVTVGMVLRQLGVGRSQEDILASFPYLEQEDIEASLAYGAWLAEGRELLSESA